MQKLKNELIVALVDYRDNPKDMKLRENIVSYWLNIQKQEVKMENVLQGDKDCVMACISIVSKVPMPELHERYPMKTPYGVTVKDMLNILSDLGIDYVQQVNDILVAGRVYIVGVPSLNFKGDMHCIVVQYTMEGEFHIFDPNEDYPGREYYTNGTFKNWADVVEVII